MMYHVFGRARRHGHVEHEPGLQIIAERPAYDLPGPSVENDGEEEKARRRRYEGDIYHPAPIRTVGGEVALHEISGRGPIRGADGGDGPAPAPDARDPGLAHRLGDPIAPDLDAFGPQLGMNARCPVGLMPNGTDRADAAKKGGIASLPLRRLPIAPCIEVGGGNAQNTGHDADRTVGLVRPHQLVRPFGAGANQAFGGADVHWTSS